MLVCNYVIGFNLVDWKVFGGVFVNWCFGYVFGVDGVGMVVVVVDDVMCYLLGCCVVYY